MDPVSIIGLVGACVNLAIKGFSGLESIHNFYKGHNQASQILERLISDVDSAKILLRSIEQQFRMNEHSLLAGLHRTVERRFEVCSTVLQQVNEFSEEHKKRAERASGSSFLSHYSRFRFTWSDSEVKSLRDELLLQMQYLEMLKSNLNKTGLTTEEQRQLQKSFEKDLTAQAHLTTVSHDDTTPENRTAYSGNSKKRGFFRRSNREASRLLIDAAEVGDLREMKRCIDKNADVNYQSKKNPPDREGMAAVHMAAINGNHDALEILVGRGADLNVTEPSQHNTALHYAAANGYSPIVQYLVRSGANTEAKNHRSLTPLLMATSEPIQVFLLEAGANPHTRGIDAETALHYAAYFGFEGAVRTLIAKNADVDARNIFEQTPLWRVCANTSIPEHKSVTIAKLLLDSGASPNAVSKAAERTPFDEALRRDKPLLLRLLLKKEANTLSSPAGELYPLHRAARDGQVQALDELLPYYSSVDIRDPRENRTALHVAIASDQQGCTRVLLRKGARLNQTGHDGLAPVHLAFKFARISICEDVLEEHFCRKVPNGQLDNISGRIPIYWARTAQAVEIWAAYGGALNWKGKDGVPPLHHAVLYHDVAVVEALIKHGANCEMLDGRGCNAIEALCLEETRWRTTFDQRLAVLRLLMKHITFTEGCRTIISKWNDKQTQAILSKQLPWRSVTEMANLARSYAPLPLLGMVTLAILGARRPGA